MIASDEKNSIGRGFSKFTETNADCLTDASVTTKVTVGKRIENVKPNFMSGARLSEISSGRR